MIKQFRDYIIKGRTQAVKQVSTTKPQTPNRLKTLPSKAKSSIKNQFFERNHFWVGVKAK